MRIRYLSGCAAILVGIWIAQLFTSFESTPADPPAATPSMSVEFKAGSARHWLKHNEVQLSGRLCAHPEAILDFGFWIWIAEVKWCCY